jgi:maltooligosyltrehalose trehalohydrolase
MPSDEKPARLGAQILDHRTRFRLFTDRARDCRVRLLQADGTPRSSHVMRAEGDGYFEVTIPDAPAGTLYDYDLDGKTYPDPYARFLPRGVQGPAAVMADTYVWRHGPGIHRPLRDQVIYEIHLGTFTPEGSYAAAGRRLADLAALGVTTVELMPLSAFPGRRGWGYEGVAHFAPYAGYGSPDELRDFVDEAHRLGLSVLLDVVYNHHGPAGNYLPAFSASYFSSDTKNAWGDGPNFTLPPMREYVLANVRYWLSEFRFDGLRLDATHAIVDSSVRHVLQEIAELAHGLEPRKLVIAEDDRNDPELVRTFGLDALWADDFHHVAHVTLTAERTGYYGCYPSGAAALAETIRKRWYYDGQTYPSTGKARGKPAAHLPVESFVYCLQNHDQVGNRALGDRLPPPDRADAYRAMSTLLLFLPMTPLLFMGQEWAATSPFQFFTDHDPELGRLISAGRKEEFKHAFEALSEAAARDRVPDPQADETFRRSKLDWREREHGEHARVLQLYRALLDMRRTDQVLRQSTGADLEAHRGDPDCLIVGRRWGDEDRLLCVNLSDRALPNESLRRLLGERRHLLRSDLRNSTTDEALPPWTAVVAAGKK